MSEAARYAEIAQALHRRLQSRGDYSEILSQLTRTSLVPPRATDIYDIVPSDEYLKHLNTVMRTTDIHRQETARQLLDRAERAETIEIRNRSVIDAVAVVTEKEIVPREWRFVDRETFWVPPTRPHAVSEELWQQLTQKVATVSVATPANFEEMLATFALLDPSTEDYVEQCYQWCSFYLPYLTTDLAFTDSDREIIFARLKRMASLYADSSFAGEVDRLGARRIRLWVASHTVASHHNEA